jgi:glycosyltransferase involved in cell wall biosynthesis
MKIWIVMHGEALPVESGTRKYRAGMLFEACMNAGHDVTWWATTFWHLKKIKVATSSKTLKFGKHGKLRLLECGTYKKNVSIARLRHHIRFAKLLDAEMRASETPDVILCCYPVIEAAEKVIQYGLAKGIPVVLDVRDRWPDQYLEYLPRSLMSLGRLVLSRSFRRARYCFRTASCLTSMSHGSLEWALRYVDRTQSEMERVFYIGYASDNTRLKQETAKPWVQFIYAGTFGKTYDVRIVLEAFSQLEKEHPELPWKLVLGGAGERCDEMRAEFTSKKIVFAGWLDKEEMERNLLESDWGLVPWASEPGAFPNKVFEYFSYGIPVLNSIEGELWDLVEHEKLGVNFRIRDLEGLKDKIIRCVKKHKELPQFRDRVSACFRDRFVSDKIYHGFVEHLENVSLQKHLPRQNNRYLG